MKKYSFIIAFFILVSISSSARNVYALSSYNLGGTTYYSDGSSSYNLGGTTYFSNGGSAYNLGGTTYYNDGKGNSGSAYNLGGTTYYSNSNGNSGSAYNLGGTTYVSDNKGNSGSAYNLGGATYYNGNIFLAHNCQTNATYDSLSNGCKCNSGYKSNGTSCVYNYSYATTPTCPINSYYDGVSACKCNYGYVASGSSCVYKSTSYSNSPTYSNTCPLNSHTSLTDSTQCLCNSGFQINSTKDACVLTPPIKTNDQACSDKYGLNSNWDGTKTSSGLLNCGCQTGYVWNSTNTACIIKAATSNINYTNSTSQSNSAFILTLGKGSSGDQVTLLQNTLTNLGFYNGSVTGFFGAITEQAVMDYQTKNGIQATGTIGPLTRAALNKGL